MEQIKTLAQAILTNATTYEWSLQGMGMLRLHLPGDWRLHVWDSRYRADGVSMVHDHLQWGLHSTVIAGRLVNRRYIEHRDGVPFMFATLKPGYGCYFKHEPRAVTLRALPLNTYFSGEGYAQEPAEIHETDADDGTVTLMHKRPTNDESARVFWEAGTEWGSAEPRKATEPEVRAITQYALDRWFGVKVPNAPDQARRKASPGAPSSAPTEGK
jgi:hypothetical protein